MAAVEAVVAEQCFADLLASVVTNAQRLAYAMLQNPDDSEDAVQEAVFNAWRAFPRFRQGSNFKAWFLAIVVNECRNRKRSRWWSVVKSASPELHSEAGGEVDAAALDLRQALNRLPAEMKLVLVLRYYLDLPFEDIGNVLKVSPGAARSRVHRAVTRLRVEVPESLGDE